MHCSSLASVILRTCNPCGPPCQDTDKALALWNWTSVGVWTELCHCRLSGSITPHLPSLFVLPPFPCMFTSHFSSEVSPSQQKKPQCRLMPVLYVVWIWTVWRPAEISSSRFDSSMDHSPPSSLGQISIQNTLTRLIMWQMGVFVWKQYHQYHPLCGYLRNEPANEINRKQIKRSETDWNWK